MGSRITSSIFAMLPLLVVLMLVGSSEAENPSQMVNVLPNASFEQRSQGGVEGWSSRSWNGDSDGIWTVAAVGRTGVRSVSIASEKGLDAAWTATVRVKPKTFYELSGWIKTDKLQGAIGALVNIQNMPKVRTPSVTGTKDWTRVATFFQTGAMTELEINCLFGGWGRSTGRAWYDDVALVEVAGPREQAMTSATATVIIDVDAPCVEYNPMIFGGFIEHLGKQIYGGFFDPGSPLADETGFRLDVIEAIKELKTPVIRWPGGCFVDSYHWQKGVGKDRQPYDDDRWGVVEPNTFGTHEFIELCRRVGAEPYICQNGLADTQEMADWVAYCNSTTGKFAEMRKMNGRPEPFDVKFWSVGNERSGRTYIHKVSDGAQAMRQVDPSILVTCSGSHGPQAHIDPYLLETAGKYLSLLSIHEYWVANYQRHQTPDYLSCMMLSEKPDAHIRAIVKALDQANMQGQIKIAFDEWNLRSWHHPGFSGHNARKVDYKDPEVIALIKARDKSLQPSLYTMADALFCASFFNACLRSAEDVEMANIACLVNQTGPLYVHPTGIVKRTHFHAMAMYANLLQKRVAKLQLKAGSLRHGNQSVGVVDAIATVDEAGEKWSMAIVNRHPSDAVACTIKMGEELLDGTCKATILSGHSSDAYNDIENPDRVVPQEVELTFKNGIVELPPHSLIMIQLLDRS